MSWWQYLVVLCSLVSWVHCQAPGDGDEICLPGGALAGLHPVYPNTFKPLMDSRDYRNLLEEVGAVWQQVDVDDHGDGSLVTSWTETYLLCRQAVYVCGYEEPGQDNWLITQHISRQVNGTLLNQVVIVVEFEFNGCIQSGDCTQTFSIHRYSTSTIDSATAGNVDNYELLNTIAPNDVSGQLRQNATVYLDFDQDDNTTGFYLTIRDMSTCMFIHRVLVYYAVCPNVIQGLVNLPETIAPAQNLVGQSEIFSVTTGTCVENSSPELGQPNPEVNCLAGGQWNPRFQCLCNDGFHSNDNGTACLACVVGEYVYASAGVGSCLPCPANSDSEAEATICDCNEGYYRSDTEGPEDGCTQPPSAPQNLTVVNVTNTSVYLTWEAPSFDGGRNDTELEYQLSYQRTDGSEFEPQVYGRVSGTEGVITGLAPFTEYNVFVSAENGASSQATDASGRTVSATIMTEEGTPSEISQDDIVVDMGSDVVTWPPPRDLGGEEILRYDIRIRRNGTDVTTVDVPGTSTSFDFAALGLQPGFYEFEIRAVSVTGPGEYSTPQVITVGDNPTDTSSSDGSSSTGILYSASIGGALVFLLLTASIITFLAIMMRKYHHAVKLHREQQEEIPDYASVAIVRLAGVDMRPDLPERRKEIHVDRNPAYGTHQLEKQANGEKSDEVDCDRKSMISFDDDGYPIMQRTGEIVYMDELPLQTGPATMPESHDQVPKEQCSKPKPDADTECDDDGIECDEDDGYPRLWP